MQSERGWIGVDLDGTLAEYHTWDEWDSIGKPVPLMLARVQGWVKADQRVKIFTARVSFEEGVCKHTGVYFTKDMMIEVIQDWLEYNGLPRLEVTATKDLNMSELWDDRAVQVMPNTGLTFDQYFYGDDK